MHACYFILNSLFGDKNNALQFHPCCCKGYKLLSFCSVQLHCVKVPSFLDPLICWWALRLLPTLGYCKLCCYEHWGAQVLLDCCFRVLGYNLSSGIAGSKESSIFSFLRKFHTLLHSGLTSLHSHQNTLGFPFLRMLSNICLWICLCWPLWLVWDGTSLWF